MSKPLILVSNDDGIDSHFLVLLAKALQKDFSVVVAAPLGEQSWIGRALSRYNQVHVSPHDGFGCPAWALDGTPADCANIALAHLLPEKPIAVVSGINIGYNVSLSSILSSGTIAAAIEGALWGLPAFAFSQQIPPERFEEMRQTHGRVSDSFGKAVELAAERAKDFVLEKVNEPHKPLTVHNVNFPVGLAQETPIQETRPAVYENVSLFAQETATSYHFSHPDKPSIAKTQGTDIQTIQDGYISYTELDYSALAPMRRNEETATLT